ncbi:tRNA (N(6)-L-threonylcarbamoyladenosine(37)-C(2))-methylthiotransferase MtaB [Spirochaetia bacterium]|nr:tRNA (N(6)-L-threonylcarbamoyladenosine(37)-C(2))-methylthiotransferase MtaB [Spirochaetia bacterium]
MISIAIQTLGCKLNQLESEAIAASFKLEGFRLVRWGEAADLLVVNTCTVTSKAEQKARRIIRKALNDNPAACVIVTGCYAQLDGAAIAALESDSGVRFSDDGGSAGDFEEISSDAPAGICAGSAGLSAGRRLFVVSGDLKSALLTLPRYAAAANEASAGTGIAAVLAQWQTEGQGGGPPPDPFAFNTGDFSFHSRASLKIQDGCDHRCTYCRVPLARGSSVSLDAETALERLRYLEERGYGEAILTGVNINQYRWNKFHWNQFQGNKVHSGAFDLGELLNYLLRGTERIAIRLSSLEPEGITAGFLSALENPRVRPHFHLSIQSGSREVLEKMGRWYTPDAIETAIRELRARKDDPFLACDMITGFPGETAADFEQTRALCERAGFAWIHAFPYSPRPGTAAPAFTGRVSEAAAVSRVDTLLALARQGRAAYIRRWLGKTVEALDLRSIDLRSIDLRSVDLQSVGGDAGAGGRVGEAASGGVDACVGTVPARYTAAVSENYLKLLIPRTCGTEDPVSGGGHLNAGQVFRCRIATLPETGSRFDAIGERLRPLDV